MEVRWPGSVHDALVFHNCEVNQRFRDKKISPFYKEIIPGHTPVPPLLLGDPAYPLLSYLMKEYSSGMENRQIYFNNRLRIVRNQIECAFGRLKGRCRILERTIDLSLEWQLQQFIRVPYFIIFVKTIMLNIMETTRTRF